VPYSAVSDALVERRPALYVPDAMHPEPVPPRTRMNPWIVWAIVFALVGGVLAAYNYAVFRAELLKKARNIPPIRPVPPFRLQERSGAFVEDRQLRGKVWIADFIFTRCPGPCADLSRAMAGLQERLAGKEDVVLASFTVDPEFDTPEVLRGYAERYGAHADRWLFLTGDAAELRRLIVKGFMLAVADQEPEKVETEGLFVHSTLLMLVDKEGRIRAYYDSTSKEAMEKLMGDIEFLRRGGQ